MDFQYGLLDGCSNNLWIVSTLPAMAVYDSLYGGNMKEKTKAIVEQLLKEDPRCRDDDKWLIIQTLRKLGFKFWIDYRDLDKIPAFETITKCRRLIQNQENKYNENHTPQEGVTFEEPIEKLS